MSNKLERDADPDQPTVYQIRIEGHLGPQWTEWFEGMSITLEDNGDTLITGPVIDQAALHGLLKRVRDLGMPLISVLPAAPGRRNFASISILGLYGCPFNDQAECGSDAFPSG